MTCYDSSTCVDCNVDCMEIAEYYMVTDACWKRAGMGPYDGQLCIGCIEKRLGKQLTPRNFTDCPLNWRNALLPDYASPRLVSRLYHGAEKSKWARGAFEAIELLNAGRADVVEQKLLMSFANTTVVDELDN